jgi:hypothetical protein
LAYPNTGGKPQFLEFITPIGLLTHCSHDKPLMKQNETTRQPIYDEQGFPEGEYRVTMAWEKTRIAELQDLINKAREVQAQAWPESLQPGAFFALEAFFRDGDSPAHNTKKREYLFGCYYLNFKQKAIPSKNPMNGQISYSGAPGLVGPYGEDIMPLDIYSGCTGRVSGIMFGTEYMGKNFISTRLNNIQKYEDGEKLGNTRPDAKTQFSPLKTGAMAIAGGIKDVL